MVEFTYLILPSREVLQTYSKKSKIAQAIQQA